MPVEWKTTKGAPADAGAPLPSGHGQAEPACALYLRPNRSLSDRGFAQMIGFAALGLALPLLALLGTPVLWGLLPFMLGTLWLLWVAVRRNTADGALCEEVLLWPDLIRVIRHNPRAPDQTWQANPYWTRLKLREDGPVEKYLTLEGAGREIELGAFLSPEERVELHAELGRRIARLGPAPR